MQLQDNLMADAKVGGTYWHDLLQHAIASNRKFERVMVFRRMMAENAANATTRPSVTVNSGKTIIREVMQFMIKIITNFEFQLQRISTSIAISEQEDRLKARQQILRHEGAAVVRQAFKEFIQQDPTAGLSDRVFADIINCAAYHVMLNEHVYVSRIAPGEREDREKRNLDVKAKVLIDGINLDREPVKDLKPVFARMNQIEHITKLAINFASNIKSAQDLSATDIDSATAQIERLKLS